MRLSTRGRYAVRAMLDLALHNEGSPILRQDIARRQDLSMHYLEQLLVRLRKARLVESVRGPGGGYRLARSPAHIRISDIVLAVEGPIVLAPCLNESSSPKCRRAPECVTHELWRSLSEQIVEALDAVTLANLCQQTLELTGPAS